MSKLPHEDDDVDAALRSLPAHEQRRHAEIIAENVSSEADLLTRLRSFQQDLAAARRTFEDLQYGTRRGVNER